MTSRIARRRAFTLVEMLVVTAITALLVTIVLASVSKVRAAARSVICMNSMKTVGYEFFHFADDYSRANRGDSAKYGGKTFRIEDFQEKQYRIDEFWDGGDVTTAGFGHDGSPMLCASAEGAVQRQRGLPCSERAVTPIEYVSTAFNMRLDQVSTTQFGMPRLQRTLLRSDVLDHPSVPLMFDADGEAANAQGVLPYYAAPPVGDEGLYESGDFWFPSKRHAGRTNVGFVGGHVLRSMSPEDEHDWEWEYQPPLR